jgi:hypothetical protein
MKYDFQEWTIVQLCALVAEDRLNLNPPYQRNSVWSVRAQKRLVETIRMPQPIPNFFIRRVSTDLYEMVDGQQRTRSILAYRCGDVQDADGNTYNDLLPEKKTAFDSYRISVTIISDLQETESIEAYYALVNSTGLRVNRPEIFKAEYHDSNFLGLITEMATTPCFYDLKLFTKSKQDRMEDWDFVSELLSLLKYGITDKKETVDTIFGNDIDRIEYATLAEQFKCTIRHFVRFNARIPICRTRYRQKNDFYTLFGFVHSNVALAPEDLDYYYLLLVKIEPYISPSQEYCDPLKYYAMNCVTQSNSKKARLEREEFLNSLLLNETPTPNDLQLDLIHFFNMKEDDLVNRNGHFVLDKDKISDPYNYELLFKGGR